MLDVEREVEGIERACLLVRAQTQTQVRGPLFEDAEGPMTRESMQAERVADTVDADRAAPGPADDREQNWRRVRPDLRLGRPDQRHAVDHPGAKFGAAERDLGPRTAIIEHDVGHDAPSSRILSHLASCRTMPIAASRQAMVLPISCARHPPLRNETGPR